MNLPPLPIDEALPRLIDALKANRSVVLRAPTGAGKTTRVPPALLDAGLGGNGRIVMLEPRRLAARAAATRISSERGTKLGGEVGYQVRFDSRVSRDTRIAVVTPGVVLNLLQENPFLEGISILVFDEFHERSLEVDLALGMARLVQQTVRPDLKLVVMSATLASEKLAGYLGDCPVVDSEGRLFPVEVAYRPRPPERSWPEAAADATGWLLRKTEGDVLVFLPGLREIRETARELEPLAEQHGLEVLPLHGDLPLEQQSAALLPMDRRKIVLATNVAETSVTVEGITGVVDTGLARQMRYDPAVGLDRLELTNISQASAEQRTGRAGRTRPGVCVRLWAQPSHRGRPEQTDPEIRRVDLSGAVLHLLAFGEKDPLRFPWLDPPAEAVVAQALDLLRMLGAVDANGLTDLGRRMAELPAQPRIARLLLEGSALGVPRRAALTAALLAERDPFNRQAGNSLRAGHSTESDVVDRVEALEEFERSGRFQFPIGELHRGGASFVLRARDQLVRMLDTANAPQHESAEGLMRALLAAFPDRVARRRNPNAPKGLMVGGRGVKLMPSSKVLESELFLCIDVDAGQTEALVRLASAVRRDWLPPQGLVERVAIEFNPNTEKIEAKRVLAFEGLQLESNPVLLPDTSQTAPILAEAALKNWPRVGPADDSPAGQFLLRVRWLREHLPELELPAFDQADLSAILNELCLTCRSFAELRQADWLGVILGRLSYQQRQAVEREAPTELEVPSGSRIKLTYEMGKPPILAVRIQELFGLPETPRVAGGRVKVLLHLLAPNFRPQQVTEDLASFWKNTYPTVRKELRSRYPKHSWPEDPLEAEAMRGPKRRGQ